MKTLLTLNNQVDKKKTKKILLLAYLIQNLQKQADEENFQKSN